MALTGPQIKAANAAITKARAVVAAEEAKEPGFTIFKTSGSLLRDSLDVIENEYQYALNADEWITDEYLQDHIVGPADEIAPALAAKLAGTEVHAADFVPDFVPEALNQIELAVKVGGVILAIVVAAYVWRAFK